MTRLPLRTQPLRSWLAAMVVLLLGAGLWTATSSRATTVGVEMRGFAFVPAEVTVAVGDTVTWTNHDGEAHAVQGGPMNSPDVPPGGSFSATFNSPGDVNYICRLHTYMTGVVHVTNEGATTTTTTAPPTTTTTAPATTTTTEPGGTTTTTTPGGTTTTTEPGGTTTTTTAPPSGGPEFQDVPDDPSATYPPGTPGSRTPPPSTAPQPTTTTAPPPSPPPGEQEVPNDPSGDDPPNRITTASAGDAEPAGTDLGDGTSLAPYTVEGGVKVFKLVMAPTTIEVSPGVVKPAYAFNGTVPGPVLRVNEGDKVRFIVDNKLPFATGVHWHGMILPNEQDGVPGITQPPIEPGERYIYDWTAVATGTHWYHSHSSGRHIGKGLYGALEVVPKTGDIAADRDYRVMLGDTDLGFTLNGRSYPSTPKLKTKVGEKVRFRVINTGDQVHALHLHGVPFEVVAQDGNKLPAPLKQDTLTIAPGQTYDLVATQVNPGRWLLHCHMFVHSHMSADEHPPGHDGMNGMVTIVETAPSDGAALPKLPLDGTALDTSPVSSTGTPDSPSGTRTLGVLGAAAVLLVLLTMRSDKRRRRLPISIPSRKESPR